MTNLLLFLLLVAVIAVSFQLRKLIMTFEEYAAQMDALGAQLNKALQEIIIEIQGLDVVPQPLVDKLVAAQSVAQQLDDLNPDPPKPNP
jgi:hypothetical protein